MFVIQYYIRGNGFKSGKWEPFHEGGVPKRYETLERAQQAFKRMGFTADCRIAEEYTVTRYKAIQTGA